jgi:hypothetical protein
MLHTRRGQVRAALAAGAIGAVTLVAGPMVGSADASTGVPGEACTSTLLGIQDPGACVAANQMGVEANVTLGGKDTTVIVACPRWGTNYVLAFSLGGGAAQSLQLPIPCSG